MQAPSSRSSASLFWPLQLGGWLAFGVAMALSRVGRYPLDYMVATKAVLAGLGLLTSLGLRAFYRRALPTDAAPVRTVVVTAAASYAAAMVWTVAYNVLDHHVQVATMGRAPGLNSFLAFFGGSVYHSFALLAWSVLYVAIRRHLAFEAERARHLRADALAQRARLQALRYQLQPHFLFNALNALSTLIVEERTAEASRMVSRLADFLRFTLAGSDADEVPLEEELEFARRYLEIERVRFGERLAVRFDVPAAVMGARVPNLLLQPLVENAIRHGLATQAGGSILVEARRADGILRLAVVNDGGNGASHTTSGNGPANGIGLANTRERLTHLYGDRHRLELRHAGAGARVEIELPYREGPA